MVRLVEEMHVIGGDVAQAILLRPFDHLAGALALRLGVMVLDFEEEIFRPVDVEEVPQALLRLVFAIGEQQFVAVDGIGRPLAGEAQSTVVPPSAKPAACRRGRLLASIDGRRPPATGLVLGRDLGATDPTATVQGTFDAPPNQVDYAFGTNDHDLVALPNGDVLYLTGAFTRRPLTPKPAWFDVAYRGSFGPGARTSLMVWRSTDCGATFHFVSEFDPAQAGDGSCALPQHPRKTTPPGSPERPLSRRSWIRPSAPFTNEP